MQKDTSTKKTQPRRDLETANADEIRHLKSHISKLERRLEEELSAKARLLELVQKVQVLLK